MPKNDKIDINKCKRCNKPVKEAKTSMKCITCGVSSHKSCLAILKNIVYLDEENMNCCNNDIEVPTGSAAGQSESCVKTSEDICALKVNYLEEIIKQKDLIIQNQEIAIKSLQDQVILLKQVNHSSSPSVNGLVSRNTAKTTKKNLQTANKIPSNDLGEALNGRVVSNAIQIAQAAAVCDRVINLNKDSSDVTNLSLNPRKIPKSRTLLIGAKNEPLNIKLKVSEAVTMKHFHVTNWHPDTLEIDLDQYLKAFSSQIRVEKLNSRRPQDYASFKISVPISEAQKLMLPEIWPVGIRVNQFFQSRNGKPRQSDTTNET